MCNYADTRQLTGAARLLYAGARKTREGVEIILRDQDAALVNIARLIGAFKEVEQKPADMQSMVERFKNITNPNEASRVYQSIMMS
jgi:phage terminase small subunit